MFSNHPAAHPGRTRFHLLLIAWSFLGGIPACSAILSEPFATESPDRKFRGR